MNNTAGRLLWIDVAKGVGIILVVTSHVLLHSALHWAGAAAPTIYLFHMPLFFVLAGMTMRVEPLADFVRRKMLSLLLPYLIFLTLLGLAALAATCTLGVPFPELGIDRCAVLPVKLLLGGSSLGGIFGTFWFIPCLLSALIMAQACLQSSSKNRLFAAGVLLAYALPILFPFSSSVLGLGVAPMAAILVLVGYWLKNTQLWLQRPTLLLSFLVATVAIPAQIPIDMKYGSYGVPISSMVGAVAIACLVMRGSQAIERWPAVAPALSALGQRSITVMYLHQAVHLLLRQSGFSNDLLIIAAALAVPLLLDRPLRQLVDFSLGQTLFRKSPKV